MFQKHAVFNPPENENAKIWRYMDFTKFVSMLDSKALFFTNVDSLEDKFEGSFSKYIFDPSIEKQATEEQHQQIRKAREEYLKYNRIVKKRAFINCWHLNEFESAAMWKLHLKSEEGIAIQSTYSRLVESFRNFDENNIFIGKVNYIDYEKEQISLFNAFSPFICKRKSFEHERELRAVLWNFPIPPDPECGISEPKVKAKVSLYGRSVPVELKTLVDTVYVSPTSEKWFEDLVVSVMKKYDFEKTVTKSSLANDPIF
jgi:hypothetical protein